MKSNPAREKTDYMRLRQMFIDEYNNDPLNRNWAFPRLDWVRYHYMLRNNMRDFMWEQLCHIWETEDGDLAGAVLFELPGFCSLQIRPDLFSSIDWGDMISRAEEMQRTIFMPQGGEAEILFEIDERDSDMISIFEGHGYVKDETDYMLVFGDMDLHRNFPVLPLPEGFKIRPVRDDEDLLNKHKCHSAAFNLGDRYDEDSFSLLSEAPGYDREMDLIIECGNRFAGNCQGWYDSVNRRGTIEPLGIVPDFQKMGLGKAIVYETFRRLRDRGAEKIDMVSSEDNRAFYESVGYSVAAKKHTYGKKLY